MSLNILQITLNVNLESRITFSFSKILSSVWQCLNIFPLSFKLVFSPSIIGKIFFLSVHQLNYFRIQCNVYINMAWLLSHGCIPGQMMAEHVIRSVVLYEWLRNLTMKTYKITIKSQEESYFARVLLLYHAIGNGPSIEFSFFHQPQRQNSEMKSTS